MKKLNMDNPKSVMAIACATLCMAAVLAVPPASGAEQKYPAIEGALSIEIENDWNYDSDSGDNIHNQLYTKIQPEFTLRFTPEFSLFAHGVLTPVTDPDAGEDRAFEDHGLYIEDLFLSYETDRFSVKGGKFTPDFGIGWDQTAGVYGSGFAEAGYEFSERIGIAGSVTFGSEKAGTHRFEASTFFLDTSVLAQSTLRSRGTTTRSDGGVSNTEDFSSFALSLNGEDFGGIRNLRYHAGYIY